MKYIYKFFNNNNECLYVGKTGHLKSRFNQHKRDKIWWAEIERIEYAICEKEFMIDLYEIYYINTLDPKYNLKDTRIKHLNFKFPQLTFFRYFGEL
jgi:excinuclease UvrABC nuclease subunit